MVLESIDLVMSLDTLTGIEWPTLRHEFNVFSSENGK